MMEVRFVLRDCDTYATIYHRDNGKPVGTIFRGRIYSKEPAFTVRKDGETIGTAETRGELRKLVHGTNWD